jgi:hypothetical protein
MSFLPMIPIAAPRNMIVKAQSNKLFDWWFSRLERIEAVVSRSNAGLFRGSGCVII